MAGLTIKLVRVITFLVLLVFLLLACNSQRNKHGNDEVTTSSDLKISAIQTAALSVVYHSTDGGKTWSPFANGIPQDATVSSFLTKGKRIFATTDNNGIYSIREGEKEWKRIDEDLPENVDINAMVAIGNALIIGTLRHGMLLSENGGKNWHYPAGQIKNTSIRGLHIKENILFAGADNGIYKSVDNGNTWKHVYNGVQVNGFTTLHNQMYAALMNGAIMTDDNGANWKYVYAPHTLHDISNDGTRLYAMTLGGGLKKSSNNGLTWENVNNGLGTLNLYTFELKNFGKKIFAAQWYGIYASDNWGKNWRIINNGLPDSTAFTTLETTSNGLIAGIGGRKK